MRHAFPLALALTLAGASIGSAREARLVRYPHYHGGKGCHV